MGLEDPSKELRLLLAFFGEAELPDCTFISPAEIPQPCHRLLVHDQHMTVVLEEFYRRPMEVRPYRIHRQGDMYGRKLDLFIEGTDQIVMTGVMLINLTVVTPAARKLIVAAQTPLGRILVEHQKLRRISHESLLRVAATDPLARRVSRGSGRPAFGRLATIYCDEKPAVDLLEIVPDESLS